jgi:glyoxylase-like metal-dependent hydrolase (beta-lactamase superfamily II)/predicted ester cyclase
LSDATESTKQDVSAEAAQETGEKTRTPGPGKVARAYFEALAARDPEAMASHWEPGGVENIAPLGRPLSVPDEMVAFFTELFTAMPDMRTEVLDVVAARNQAAVRWHGAGTFCGGPFQGIEPTGARVDLEGLDLLTIEDGKIVRNDAYYDSGAFARAVGLLPPQESTTERRMAAAFNFRTRLLRPFVAPAVSQVAEGVWLVRGGFPQKVMNVYLIEDDGGVTVFDAGIRGMERGISSVAAGLGGVKRVVLGHGHPDHRGAAPGIGAPVFCHPDNVADTEGDGGAQYFDFSKLDWYARPIMKRLTGVWDGGPVKVEGTVSEGDEIAGFTVVDLPGHAPGLIGLWREEDRLALSSDTFYTLNPQTGQKGAARVPHPAFNRDTEQARASIRKLAEMEPASAWPGHADPLTGDVREQLEQALLTS